MVVRECLSGWLRRRVRPSVMEWLTGTAASIANGARDARLLPAFSDVPRHVGTAPLDLSDAEFDRATALNADWDPSGWTVDQAARVLLLLSLPTHDMGDYARRLRLLARTATDREAAALEAARPVLPEIDA